jgi:hypothetical protein
MPEYSADRFYVDATDGRGHSEKVHAALPPGIHSQLGALIAGRTVPTYRTMADFVRDAIIHRLHWMDENYEITEELQDELTRIRSLDKLMVEQKRDNELQLLIEGYRGRLNGANAAEKSAIRERISSDLNEMKMPSRYRTSLEELL